MGGLVAGALLALVIGYKRPGERAGVAVIWHILQVAALALVVVSFVMVTRNFNKSYADIANVTAPSPTGDESNIKGYLDALNGGQTVFIRALTGDNPKGIDEAVQALEKAAPPDQTAAALRDELKSLLVRARDFLAASPAKRTKQRTGEQKEELILALNAWIEKRDQWVKTEGGNYGLYLPPPPPPEQDAPKEKK
jgi:hypothetical protein